MIPATNKLAEKIRGTERQVDIQRALIATRVYQATEGEATIIRRAKALAAILSEMDIRIDEGELIVGNQARQPRAGPLIGKLITQELDTMLGVGLVQYVYCTQFVVYQFEFLNALYSEGHSPRVQAHRHDTAVIDGGGYG